VTPSKEEERSNVTSLAGLRLLNKVYKKNNIELLFTIGCVYSTKASGATKQLKQIIQIEHNIVKNLNILPGVKQVGYLWPRI